MFKFKLINLISILSLVWNRAVIAKISRILEIIFKEFETFDNSIFKRIHLYLIDNYIIYYNTLQNYQDSGAVVSTEIVVPWQYFDGRFRSDQISSINFGSRCFNQSQL